METDNDVEVVEAARVDDELIAAFARLIPQLSRSAPVPTREILKAIIDGTCSALLLARSSRDGRIVGTLTLVTFRIPTGVRAWIEDVVVDDGVRGRGIGQLLIREAIRLAAAKGARTIDLTSRPSREAANRLYQRLGFIVRETNVYRYSTSACPPTG